MSKATLSVLLGAALLAACSRQEPAPEPVRAVRTVTITAESAGGVHEYAAEIKPRTESRLSFRVPGKMVSRSAELGQRVKAGQVLARLDPEDLRLQQAASRAAVQAAQVNVELADADLKRYQGLLAQGFVSRSEIDRRETTLKAAVAQLEQAKAQASVTVNQAAYSALTAPEAGVITAVEADPGTVLAAGTPVVRLAPDGARDAVFAVPEDSIGRIRAMLGKAGALKVRLWSGGDPIAATVREVAAAADPTTRTFLVKADVGKADVQLGQTAAVLLDLPRIDGVAKLPLTAVTQQQGKTAVWLVDKSTMTVKVQPITVAGADGNSVVVASGVAPGQVVVTAGVHVLTAGQKVKFFETPVAAR
jgi:membrane fusion protein, multidrug efflux system